MSEFTLVGANDGQLFIITDKLARNFCLCADARKMKGFEKQCQKHKVAYMSCISLPCDIFKRVC